MRPRSSVRSVRVAPMVLLAGALSVVVLAFGVGGALAATTVNCPPYGADSLQAAITAAAPGDTLLIKGTCVGNFTVTKNLTLQGSPTATLNGQGAGHTVVVSPGKTVTLTNLTITGGYANGPMNAGAGGGIFSLNATLTLNNCLVTGNTAVNGGGGIASGAPLGPSAGMLTLNSTRVTGNTVLPPNGGGGGILNHNGTAILSNSVVSGNSAFGGGGIASGSGAGDTTVGGTLTITNSVISGNTAVGGPDGGAGGIANGGTLTLTNSTVTGNQAVGGAGGGILSHGVATITGSVVSSNSAPNDSLGDQGNGGGIANANFGVDGSGVMSIINSQVTKNQSGAGGGIFTGAFGGDSSLTLTGTAVSFNSVSGDQSGGGGILNLSLGGNAGLTVTGSTLVGNLARQGLGGAIANVNQGGEADVSIASTGIGSTRLTPPYTLNPNQALFGGGIFNWAAAGPASVSLGSGALIVGNKASVDGGGIFNADGATLFTSGALILLNHPDNIASDPNF